MPILNLIHINLHVADLERSIDFYQRLGWKVMFDLGRDEPSELPHVKTNGGRTYGGVPVKAVVLSLGDDPRAATKLEIMECTDPVTTPQADKPVVEAGVHRLAMRVKDLDATVAACREAGVEIDDEPHEIKTMGGRQRFVLFTDPDNNLLEFIELLTE